MKTKKRSKLPECECGCGGTTKGGRFVPGHDAKLKKALVEVAFGGSKRAANKLEKLGWSKFLDAKREKNKKSAATEPPAETPLCAAAQPRRHRTVVVAPASTKSAAQTAAEELPFLDPPLSEHTARMLGYGERKGS